MVTIEQYQQENWYIQRFFDNEYNYKIESYPHERYVTFEKPQYQWVASYGDFLPVAGIPIKKVSRAKVLEYIKLCNTLEKLGGEYTEKFKSFSVWQKHIYSCTIRDIHRRLHSEKFDWVKSIAKEIA